MTAVTRLTKQTTSSKFNHSEYKINCPTYKTQLLTTANTSLSLIKRMFSTRFLTRSHREANQFAPHHLSEWRGEVGRLEDVL